VDSAAAASGTAEPGTSIPKEDVEAAINARKLPPYDGPTGTIEGIVRVAGDEAPEVSLRLPAACRGAEAMYGRVFREGEDRVVADVLVAVTGYDAFVPAKSDVVNVRIERCSYPARTIAMTYGQRMEVENFDDGMSFVPVLHGSRFAAYRVAVPQRNAGASLQSDPVRLYPQTPGQYLLGDYMKHTWMTADVLVLKFATHAVSGVDGRFRVEGVPIGQVSVDAWLPAIDATEKKAVEVKAGEVTTVDFVLTFDEANHRARVAAGVASSKPASVPPAPSASRPQPPTLR